MTPQPQSFALALVIMGFTAPGKRSDGSFSAKNGPADPRTGGRIHQETHDTCKWNALLCFQKKYATIVSVLLGDLTESEATG